MYRYISYPDILSYFFSLTAIVIVLAIAALYGFGIKEKRAIIVAGIFIALAFLSIASYIEIARCENIDVGFVLSIAIFVSVAVGISIALVIALMKRAFSA